MQEIKGGVTSAKGFKAAGVEAAHRGGMKAVGIGDIENLPEADMIIPGFDGITIEEIEAAIK